MPLYAQRACRILIVAATFACTTIGIAQDQLWTRHVIQPAAPKLGAINTANAADFDGDGHVDIIASFGGGVHVYAGPNWKHRMTVHHFRPGQSRTKPRSGCIHSTLLDVDGDGDLDYCGSNLTVFWLECPRNPFVGTWTYRSIDDEILGTHCLITGDVDGDGQQDLIANSGRTAKATSIPESLTWQRIPNSPLTVKSWQRHIFAWQDAPGGSHYMGIGDVNRDGRPDICCGAKGGKGFENGDWFAWWEQPANATKPWKKHLLSNNEPGATNIHPVDLNGDGHLDFFATRGHGLGVLSFVGPKFDKVEIDTQIVGPHCLATIDLDGDGDIDAATCGKEKDGVAVWYENNGEGQFTKHVIGRNQGSYDIRAIDLDQDEDLDLLIAGHGSGNIVWYENRLNRR